LLSGVFGQIVAFAVTGLLFFVGGVFLLKKNPFQNKIIGYLLIFGFYPTLIFGMVVYNFNQSGFIGKPQASVLFISILLAFVFHKKSYLYLLKIGAVYILFLAISCALLPNYFNWLFEYKYAIMGKNLPELSIHDENGKSVNLRKLDNKIIIIDVWNTSCGICIKNFPDFEKLKNEFSNDTTLKFYTLNIPINETFENKEAIAKYTNSYSFEKLYAGKDVQKRLGIVAVPVYIIIDKNKKIRYIGSLNTGTFEFYNNFYSIIKIIKS